MIKVVFVFIFFIQNPLFAQELEKRSLFDLKKSLLKLHKKENEKNNASEKILGLKEKIKSFTLINDSFSHQYLFLVSTKINSIEDFQPYVQVSIEKKFSYFNFGLGFRYSSLKEKINTFNDASYADFYNDSYNISFQKKRSLIKKNDLIFFIGFFSNLLTIDFLSLEIGFNLGYMVSHREYQKKHTTHYYYQGYLVGNEYISSKIITFIPSLRLSVSPIKQFSFFLTSEVQKNFLLNSKKHFFRNPDQINLEHNLNKNIHFVDFFIQIGIQMFF